LTESISHSSVINLFNRHLHHLLILPTKRPEKKFRDLNKFKQIPLDTRIPQLELVRKSHVHVNLQKKTCVAIEGVIGPQISCSIPIDGRSKSGLFEFFS
jgi:hypothetical protein